MTEMGVAIAAILAALGSLVTTIAVALKGFGKLNEIHIQTNSNMVEALKRTRDLEEQVVALKNSELAAALERIDELEAIVEKATSERT